MKIPNDNPGLQIRFDVHHCRLGPPVLERMQADLDGLTRQVASFPVAELQILIEHNARSNDYSVKTSLILPGSTLVGNDHDPSVHVAFQRCLQSLEENLHAYKDRLGRLPERQKQEKGTHQDLLPSVDPDGGILEEAVRDGDYTAFRNVTFGYEDAVRMRAGRWVERYPEVEARIGKDLEMDDIVEAVFLEAFEGRRPAELRFGEWLEHLIDPAVRALRSNGDAYLENVRLVRSAREAQSR